MVQGPVHIILPQTHSFQSLHRPGSVYCCGLWVRTFLARWEGGCRSDGGPCASSQAIMHHEGHMDDGINLSRSQHEESRTARVIRSTVFLFNRFIRYISCPSLGWLFDILPQFPDWLYKYIILKYTMVGRSQSFEFKAQNLRKLNKSTHLRANDMFSFKG